MREAARKPAVLAVAAFALVILVITLHWWIPWFTGARDLRSSTPAPPPASLQTATTVDALPNAAVCLSNVPMDSGDRVVSLTTGLKQRGAPAIDITVSAPGYHARATVPAGSYGALKSVQAPIAAVPRPLVATVCARPRSGLLELLANNEPRSHPRSVTSLAGRPIAPSAALTFLRSGRASYSSQLSRIADQANIVAAPAFPSWLLLVLLLVAVLGTAPAVAWALAASLRD
jgi:hypothetical protein